ncbi:MAG: hypothetical protein V4760_06255 [Bdellovibrionota bacterium]
MWSLLVLFCSFSFGATPDAWDEALRQASLQKSDVQFNALDLKQVGGAEFKTPFYELLHGEPLRIPVSVETYREILIDYSKEPFKSAVSSMARVGLGIRRNLEGDPLREVEALAKKPEGMVPALEHLHRLARKPLSSAQKSDIQSKSKALGNETRVQLAYLIEAIAHSIEWRTRALEDVAPKTLVQGFTERMIVPHDEMTEKDRAGLSRAMKHLIRDVDMPVLMAGGYDLVLAVQNSREKFSHLKSTDRFEWSTPFGQISLRGGKENDTVRSDRFPLLIVDAGGNDVYFAGAGTDLEHPVGIVLDLGGDDRYLGLPDLESATERKERRDPKTTAKFGAGVFGYAILVDAGGNDVYRSFRMTQGRGDFGIGVLWDLAGSDKYECWVQCQASSEFGLGLLIDAGGSDTYSALSQAQGFAGPRGAGVLLDIGSEADTYTAVSSPVDFPSQVDAKFNVSMMQGSSLGVRADARDGHGLAGGFGALVDGGGDNVFKAGFFAQGIAYWYGVGWLSTGIGNDRFEAGKYAQGASAHFGVGVLHDTGGNETYSVAQELGIGHGHDFGVGFLIDDSGDDTYRAPNFSLGCASAQGIGIFWDRSGNDIYESKEKEVAGCAGHRIDPPSLRFMARTLGLFMDTGGKNEFRLPGVGLEGKISSKKWVRPPVSFPAKLDRFRSKMTGVGLVTDAPETADPL